MTVNDIIIVTMSLLANVDQKLAVKSSIAPLATLHLYFSLLFKYETTGTICKTTQ